MNLLLEGAHRWRSSSCSCSCATGAPPSSRPWPCRCRSSRPSRRCTCMGFSHQRRDVAGAVAGGRHPGRRCDRRDREHRAPPAAWARRRWKRPWRPPTRSASPSSPPRHAGRGIPADGLHGRHGRHVLQAVRLDRGDRGVRLAGRRAAADADDGRLPPEADRPGTPKDELDACRYLRWVRLVPAPPARDDRWRRPLFFIGSLLLIPLLPTGFIPPDDLAQTQVDRRAAARQHLRADRSRRRAGRARC